jgi:hypothetical protein
MTTTLMMKDIPITTNDYSSYDDEYLFEMIVEFYNTYNQTNIRSLWKFHFLLDFEEEGIEDDIIIINNNMNINLTLIKKYAPDIYNSYEYEIGEYDNCIEKIYDQNLEIFADILHNRFNSRFFKYINDMEGAELSGADTDADE